MTTDNYQTIFELGLGSLPWPPIYLYVILIIGLILIKFFKNKKHFFIAGIFMTTAGSFCLLPSLLVTWNEYAKLRNEYVSGKSLVVEGVVQDFRPAPAIGSTRESFSVNRVSFSYYAGSHTPCFNNAPFRNGPIREGLYVKIHYYEDCIQRVEVLHKADFHSSHSQP